MWGWVGVAVPLSGGDDRCYFGEPSLIEFRGVSARGVRTMWAWVVGVFEAAAEGVAAATAGITIGPVLIVGLVVVGVVALIVYFW